MLFPHRSVWPTLYASCLLVTSTEALLLLADHAQAICLLYHVHFELSWNSTAGERMSYGWDIQLGHHC